MYRLDEHNFALVFLEIGRVERMYSVTMVQAELRPVCGDKGEERSRDNGKVL